MLPLATLTWSRWVLPGATLTKGCLVLPPSDLTSLLGARVVQPLTQRVNTNRPPPRGKLPVPDGSQLYTTFVSLFFLPRPASPTHHINPLPFFLEIPFSDPRNEAASLHFSGLSRREKLLPFLFPPHPPSPKKYIYIGGGESFCGRLRTRTLIRKSVLPSLGRKKRKPPFLPSIGEKGEGLNL